MFSKAVSAVTDRRRVVMCAVRAAAAGRTEIATNSSPISAPATVAVATKNSW